MNKYLTIPVTELQAIALFAAKNDVRFYLNSVAIDSGHIVATNGHYCAALPVADSEGISVIIPIESIQLFFKGLTGKQKKEGNAHINLENNTIYKNNVVIPFTPIDGTFPNWKRLIPTDKEINYHGNFNWDYMATFYKAAKFLGRHVAVLSPRGNEIALVSIPDHDFIGLLMPQR